MDMNWWVKLAQLVQTGLVASSIVVLACMVYKYKSVIADSLRAVIGAKDATIQRLEEELAAAGRFADSMLTTKRKVLEALDLAIKSKLDEADSDSGSADNDAISRSELHDILQGFRAEIEGFRADIERDYGSQSDWKRIMPSPNLPQHEEDSHE